MRLFEYLYAATWKGHAEVPALSVKHGVPVNSKGAMFGTALQVGALPRQGVVVEDLPGERDLTKVISSKFGMYDTGPVPKALLSR